MKTNKLFVIPGGLALLTVVLGLLLCSNSIHADESAVDTVQVSVETACTLSSSLGTTPGVTGSTDGEGNNSYTFTMDPGSLKEVNGSIFSTVCNDSGGYALYAIGFSGNSYDTNNTKIQSGTNPANDINTGVAPASPTSSTPSSWAMMLAPVTAPTPLTPPSIVSDFQSYHVVPATYTKIAYYTAATSSASDPGATAQAKYQVYISSSQAADTYTGKVKYTMVHPNDAPTPTPVTFDSAYAAAGKTKLNNYYKMQDMSATICSAVTLVDDESETVLIDSRDNKTYTVSKLKDGNCWMTQNLDHDIDSSKTYTPLDTDVFDNWKPALSTYVTEDSDSWSNAMRTPESYDPGTLYWNGDLGLYGTEEACIAAGGTWYDGWVCSLVSNTGDSYHHLGNYYNWTAAIAMNDSSSYTTINQDADQSICPANWTLPKGGSQTPESTAPGSLYYLLTQYGWDNVTKGMDRDIWDTPIRLSISGVAYDAVSFVGGFAGLWSSVKNNNGGAFHLAFSIFGGSKTISPFGGDSTGEGLSVRCLARWNG